MRSATLPILFMACAGALAGCTETPAVSSLTAPEAPRYAKPVGAPTATWKLPTAAAGLGLASDGRNVSGDFSVYQPGTCSVNGAVFVGGSGDATVQTNNPREKNTLCGTARTMSIVYPPGDVTFPDGATETATVFANLRNISNETTSIGLGYANRVERVLSVSLGNRPRCAAFRWATESPEGAPSPGDKVWVERIDATTYHVYTKDRGADPVPGANRAVCTTTGQAHHLSVDLYIVASQAVP